MNSDNYDYALNFIIPKGETGEQGQVGPTGPAGPPSISSIASLYYLNTSSNGLLSLQNDGDNLIIPRNSNIFTLNNNNEILLNETGYYEFTIYGFLRESIKGSISASITLDISDNHLFNIQLENLIETHFSQSNIKFCQNNDKVTINLHKETNSNASSSNVYLIIKKLAF